MKLPKILRKKILSQSERDQENREASLESCFRSLKVDVHFKVFLNEYLLTKREEYIRALHTIADPHVKQELFGKVSALDEILEEITEDYFLRKKE